MAGWKNSVRDRGELSSGKFEPFVLGPKISHGDIATVRDMYANAKSQSGGFLFKKCGIFKIERPPEKRITVFDLGPDETYSLIEADGNSIQISPVMDSLLADIKFKMVVGKRYCAEGNGYFEPTTPREKPSIVAQRISLNVPGEVKDVFDLSPVDVEALRQRYRLARQEYVSPPESQSERRQGGRKSQ